MTHTISRSNSAPTMVGLFAGIGGIERGLQFAGYESELLCEIDQRAQKVLSRRFKGVPIVSDVRDLRALPSVDLVAAGFPCQDLSQAGLKVGIDGEQSSLVGEIFRLFRSFPRKNQPRWLFLENVPYMLHLDGGRAMAALTRELEDLGMTWAYRVVDSRAFGVPQRRQRIVLLASRTEDPREVLFADEQSEPPELNQLAPIDEDRAYGFYWTEGRRGIGWAADAVPTLKGGSKLGIPSPPAIWIPRTGSIGTPDLRDVERLQGFPINWTKPAEQKGRIAKGSRWTLTGNAVCVPVARWLGGRLLSPRPFTKTSQPLSDGEIWPRAAWGRKGEVYRIEISAWPVRYKRRSLLEFLKFPLTPLSARATEGFYHRILNSRLKFNDLFLSAVANHLETMKTGQAVRVSPGAPVQTSARQNVTRAEGPTHSGGAVA